MAPSMSIEQRDALRKLVHICLYMLTFCLGVTLWNHDIKNALLDTILILWNLQSLRLLDKEDEKEKTNALPKI